MTLHVHVVAERHDNGLDLSRQFREPTLHTKSAFHLPPRTSILRTLTNQPWVSLTAVSITCNIEIENAAFFPVPDYAWAIVSRLLQI